MLAQTERASEEMRRQFARMQRALFIIWLGRGDAAQRRDLEEAASEAVRGETIPWEQLRREMNAKFGV